MNRTYSISNAARRWLLASVLLMMQTAAIGQATNAHYTYPADSSNGYWRLHTDYASRSTIIRFYDRDRQLIYQETISGRYVKLNKRTVRLFDSMLDRLVNNQLLSAHVRTHELLASNERVPINAFLRPSLLRDEPTTSPEEANRFVTQPLVNSEGKLRVIFLNPRQERVLISIEDNSYNSIYRDISSLSAYKRAIDVSQLPEGTFRFRIATKQQTRTYRLTIGRGAVPYRLDEIR
ncbi:hypothetical protein BN8_01474 [Fibrisoma limi BUZ 3]|uniref:Secretion system C-terminal sorting domain-containing protein n=1 Tax=Fibrisoma limi BUZ 3 TaxID=1185876 RepID=I2GEZ5_9BACT|nr:hypothetical protein [Fibrisoma limi]CCH52470.1 hypothetical protein BN8_01474 [Fibrisoma limi BUZ 3]